MFRMLQTLWLTAAGLRLSTLRAAPFCLVPCVGIYGATSLHGHATPHAHATATAPWRYVVLCDHCGARQRMAESPLQTLSVDGHKLQCPECARFKASWYRRGGLSVPPGGW